MGAQFSPAAATDSAERPLVAVVTPVYNGAQFLAKALACVQAQSYPNLVHVVLDNASTDATPHIIEAARAGSVPIITRRNAELLPLVDNWNRAMAMVPAEARYVQLLCADDLMRGDAVERLVDICERWPDVRYVTARDVFDGLIFDTGFDGDCGVVSGAAFEQRFLSSPDGYFPFAHMFVRSSEMLYQAPFRASTMPLSDADFVLRMVRGRRVAWINEPLYFTRDHQSSETSRGGGTSSFCLPLLEMLLSRGPEVMSPIEFEHARKANLRTIHLHLLAWGLRGERKARDAAIRQLAQLKPDLAMFTQAVVRRVSLALARRLGIDYRRPPIIRTTRVSEDDFLRLPANGVASAPPSRAASWNSAHLPSGPPAVTASAA
jgi:hypothetical protein